MKSIGQSRNEAVWSAERRIYDVAYRAARNSTTVLLVKPTPNKTVNLLLVMELNAHSMMQMVELIMKMVKVVRASWYDYTRR